MVSEKVIVILIVAAIILSIVSVIVTMSATMIKPEFPTPKVVYNYAPPKQPDTTTAQVGITVNKPIAGP
jgi:hypothetical protein